jgi:hypothetical protein
VHKDPANIEAKKYGYEFFDIYKKYKVINAVSIRMGYCTLPALEIKRIM